MNSTKWTPEGVGMIKDIKKSILKKKVMLSFIIDSYAKYDKVFRYSHILIATTAPILLLVSQETAGSSSSPSTLSVVLGIIAAGMIKVKEYLKYDKVKETAKQQTVKYEQLYQRIEREMIKPDSKRQPEEDFIYWINREFNNIEMADPDLTASLKKKFLDTCKERGIPCDEDLDLLGDLFKSTVDVVVESAATQIQPDRQEPSNQSVPSIPPTLSIPLTISNSPEQKTNELPQRRMSTIRIRSVSDEVDRAQYKNMIETVDPKQDLKWAMDRLGSL